MTLTDEQKKIIDLRISEHQHSRYETDITSGGEVILKNIIVYPNVLRPEITSALYFARFLFSNEKLYENKDVLDMGCGTGVQGLVMGLNGAKSVTFSDISHDAYQNTVENIAKFGLNNTTSVTQGDLFENILGTFDLIVFNHPFFAGVPDKNVPSTIVMLDDGVIIHKFLKDATKCLNSGGSIIMPFFESAGETNNPGVQGPKEGYDTKRIYCEEIDDENIQKGQFSVYELRPINN
jgi:methylase of polypeptide subunit release factors